MRERDFFTGRSVAIAGDAMAATAHPDATLTALDVLRAGGNAVDAAIAAMAQLCVIEPHNTGLGGDAFVLLMRDGGPAIGLNGSGRAPAAAALDWYAEHGITEIEATTPHAVTVPGAVDAWCRLLEDHGTRGLDELLRPAIRSARDGYRVLPRVAYDWRRLEAKLALDPDAARTLLPEGRAPVAGALHVQPALARTLEEVAQKGRAGFYEGWVAQDIVAKLRTRGGLHTLDDLAANTPTYVEPLQIDYRGYQVLELPPNGQGLIAQIILNVLEGYDLEALSEADRVHVLAEASKAAYLRRDALLGDPSQVEMPVERLLSKVEATRIRDRIRLESAGAPAPVDAFRHSDTTYLTVVDKDRLSVSFINSLFSGFGSGLMGEASGVVLQNRGSSFRLEPGHPNAIAPFRRPMHTIIPGLLARDGRPVMPFGVMGGHYQPVGHAQVVTRMLDLGLDPQAAIAWPRSFAYGGELQLEPTVGADIAADLQNRGHRTTWLETPVGGGQAIWIDHERGVLLGGTETRKDGSALGLG